MNLDIDFNTGKQIISIIVEVGKSNFESHNIDNCEILTDIARKINNHANLAKEEKELLANFLYLNAVMDQGRDPIGVKSLLIQITNYMYEREIKFLHNPKHFFENPQIFAHVLKEEHESIKKARSEITGLGPRYNLFDTKINPYTMHRWGTVMLCLKKIYENDSTLLSFMRESGRADNIVNRIRDDIEYGLGNAIGHKASRLLVKWLIHTFPIIEDTNLRWGPNSYEIPLDSNVGRVFMRSGLLFLFVEEDVLWEKKCWIEQLNGKINLSAQRLNDLRIPKNTPIESELLEVLRSWGVRKRNLMKAINAFVLKLNNLGHEATVGQIDDGFMYIGQTFCKNEIARCKECPLSCICIANIQEPLLKSQFYCGVGSGVFFGR